MIYVKKLELVQVVSLARYHTILAVRFSCDILNISVKQIFSNSQLLFYTGKTSAFALYIRIISVISF